VSRLSAAHRHGRGYSKGAWTGQAKMQETNDKCNLWFPHYSVAMV